MSDDPDAERSAPALHHVALRCRDVEKTARFYEQMLGLELVRDARPRALWLGLGGGAVLMVEAREPGEPAIAAGSRELLALRVSPDRKTAIRTRAVTLGVFDGETQHTVYFRDPDGRRVGVSTFPLDPPVCG
jgi:glyoxylase I family protein